MSREGEEEEDRKGEKEMKEAKDRRWSVGSHGVSLSSRKVSPVMSMEPKWRRAECGVATNDKRHVCRTKTMMKDREQGKRKCRGKIIGQ